MLCNDAARLKAIIKENRENPDLHTNLQNLLVLALARGCASFVKMLLLGYEISIRDVLDYNVLRLLYEYQYNQNPRLEEQHPDVWDGIDTTSNPDDRLSELNRYIYQYNRGNSAPSDRKLEGSFISERREEFCKWFPEDQEFVVKDHVNELFVWANVCNLPDVAKVLWSFGTNQMGKALIACDYFKRMAQKYERLNVNDHKIKTYRGNEATFGQLACQLLDECYKKNEESATKLIMQNIDFFKDPLSLSTLDLAVKFKNRDFISHCCVQKVLTDVWSGKD